MTDVIQAETEGEEGTSLRLGSDLRFSQAISETRFRTSDSQLAEPQSVNQVGTLRAEGNSRIHVGNVINYHHESLFGSLAIHINSPDAAESTAIRNRLAQKDRLLLGRRPPRAIDNQSYYVPYTTVKNQKIKSRLLQIASLFQFLDRGFAEYFQKVVPSFDHAYVRQRLRNIRQDVARRQRQDSDQTNEAEATYLGDLGHFCETVSEAWSQTSVFTLSSRRDQEIFHYLQDAFEVPYWELMLDLFLEWRANSKSLSGDVVIRVLHSLKIEVLNKKNLLLGDAEGIEEDIAPILEGIESRINVLESVWDAGTSSLLEVHELFMSPIHQTHRPSTPVAAELPVKETPETSSSRNETVTLMTLILLFLIGAMVPGYKAFAISMKNSGTGSKTDADYWYLIQSNIMSVLGSLISVVPLLKKSWFSPAYTMMWISFGLGLGFAVASIIIYPVCNTGWSSIVAFFSTIASTFSVLVITQATSKEDIRPKLKTD